MAKKQAKDNSIEPHEEKLDNDFFSSTDIIEFDEELSSDRQEAKPMEEGLEDDLFEDDPSVTQLVETDQESREIFKICLGFIDETRALIASLYSGQPKEKYIFYDVGKMSNDHYLIRAGGMLAKKWQLSYGPELVLAMALVGSSIYVAGQARKDKQAEQATILKETKKTTKETKAKSTESKPMD